MSIPSKVVAVVDDDPDMRKGIERLLRAYGFAMQAFPSAEEFLAAAAESSVKPAVYPYRYFAAGGGLICYGPDLIDQHRRAASYVDRILKGEKPADLPVQAPTEYKLVINLKTAKALGLDVPPTLLARADEVIE
jgi:ABC-type uncharacterized transport system substrate-binding protein